MGLLTKAALIVVVAGELLLIVMPKVIWLVPVRPKGKDAEVQFAVSAVDRDSAWCGDRKAGLGGGCRVVAGSCLAGQKRDRASPPST